MTIRVAIEAGFARVVLDRPERKNAITLAMRCELATQLERLGADPAVRVVVLSGGGDDFCAGADVGEFGSNDLASTAARGRLMYRCVLALTGMDKPAVAVVRGAAAGAGWSLALACDLVLAGDSARFMQAFSRLGLAPDAGFAWFLNRLVGPARAADLLLSGRAVRAPEALALGLVTEVVPDQALEARVLERVASLAAGPTLAYGMTKRMLRLSANPGLEQFLDQELQMQSLLLRSEDHQEALAAFRQKRSASFQNR